MMWQPNTKNEIWDKMRWDEVKCKREILKKRFASYMNVIVNEATIPALNILHISLYIFCLFVVHQSPTVDSFARDSEYVCACVC